MVPKVYLDSTKKDPSTAESIADLYYEIGRDQISRSRPAAATKWLARAQEVLSSQDLEELSSDASELQVSVMHSLIKALISLGGQEHIAKAWNILAELELEHGDRLAVSLLRLDLYSLDPVYPAQDYCDVLQKIVRTVHLTDSNVKTALHHIHKLRTRNARMAHMVLVTLAIERLAGVEEYRWLEKTLITLVWNFTTSAELTDTFGLLRDFLETLQGNIGRAISPSATHAAQILMCKRIDTSYNQEQYDAAQTWCRLSLHPIFSNSGTLNTGKLQRKLILCALGGSDPQRARDAYHEMSDTNQKHPSTQYLLYKIALRCQDVELATQCLDTICRTSTKDATLLYACVLEAQRAGNRAQSIASMQRVLDKYDYGAPSGVHLPALLRCTARMLIQELDNAPPESQHNMEGLCKLFDGAAKQAKTSRRDSKDELFSLAELDWFSRNSYNLALRVCSDWSPQETLRLVSACLKFMDLYPSDMDPDVVADLSLRRLFCDFLCASLLIVIARDEENIESQLQHYLNVRKAANDFRKRLQEQLERLEGGAKEDLSRKHNSLLAYDFEAAARLKAWESFEPLIKDCEANPDPKIYAIMADIVLSCEAPTEVQIATLQQIIHATWPRSHTDIAHLSRWIRCLFSLSLTSSSSLEISEHLLTQVIINATNAKSTPSHSHSPSPSPYPPEELEYLATTAFNRAVDFYCASQDAACRRWAGKALEMAELCRDDDGGALRDLLMDKFARLTWDAAADGADAGVGK